VTLTETSEVAVLAHQDCIRVQIPCMKSNPTIANKDSTQELKGEGNDFSRRIWDTFIE
jgi:hypothetical protein